jgi:ornithine cyclodeaminase/alanine dehydrogenase-like protein (mu-crystallin family)
LIQLYHTIEMPSSAGGSVQVLDAEEIARLLDMPSCIRAVEAAFRARGEGRSAPSAMVGLELGGGGLHAKMASLEVASRLFAAAKVNANFPGNPVERNLPTIQGVLVLFDATSGVPLVVMDSAPITTLRTAAASAVAARWLARADASTVTFVGCGVQARAHLTALRQVRRVQTIYAIDLRPDVAETFCRFALAECGIAAHIPASLGEATRASDIVVTTTPSRRALLDVGDVSPGTFVAAVGADNEHKQEITPALLRTASVVVDDLEQCARFGDLHHALASGALRREDVRASLDQIVALARPGRSNDEEIIIFDSTGLALEDVAAAATVFERLTSS